MDGQFNSQQTSAALSQSQTCSIDVAEVQPAILRRNEQVRNKSRFWR